MTFETYFHLSAYPIFYLLAYWVSFLLSPFKFSKTFSLVSLALLMRLIASFFIPMIIIFDDEIGYARMGHEAMIALELNQSQPWGYNPWGNVTGIFFYIFGESSHTVKAFNTFISIVSAFLLFQIAEKLYANRATIHSQLYHQRKKDTKKYQGIFLLIYRVPLRSSFLRSQLETIPRMVLYFSLFLPPLVFLSSIALKEQMIAFLLVVSLYGILQHSLRGWFIAIIALILLWTFRSSLAVLIIAAVALYWTGLVYHQKYLSKGVKRVGIAVALGIVMTVGLVVAQQESIHKIKTVMVITGEEVREARALQQAQSKFDSYFDAANPFTIKNLLIAPLRALYSPSPFKIILSPTLQYLLEAFILLLFIFWAFPYMVIGIAESVSNIDRLLIAVFYLIVFLTASYSALTFAPEPFRYRWPGLPLYFMLAAYGWFHKQYKWRKTVVWGWWISVSLGGIVYLM